MSVAYSSFETEIDPCAFVVTPQGSEKVMEKRRQYLARLSGLFLRSPVKDWPRDEPSYRNYLKLIAADAIVGLCRTNPAQPITREIISTAAQKRTDDDYSAFLSAKPDYCHFTGRHVIAPPSLLSTSWENYGIATAFNVLRDYATGYNPHAELSLRYAMTEEGIVTPDDPLYLAPIGKHPAITAGLDNI